MPQIASSWCQKLKDITAEISEIPSWSQVAGAAPDIMFKFQEEEKEKEKDK